jgi:hypothetical protein
MPTAATTFFLCSAVYFRQVLIKFDVSSSDAKHVLIKLDVSSSEAEEDDESAVSSSEAEEDDLSAAVIITIDSDAGSEGARAVQSGEPIQIRSALGVDAVEASQGHRVGIKNTGLFSIGSRPRPLLDFRGFLQSFQAHVPALSDITDITAKKPVVISGIACAFIICRLPASPTEHGMR